MNNQIFNLTVSYDIPNSGMYVNDLLAGKLAGEQADNISWGTHMFVSRILEYKFPDQESKDAATQRFLDNKMFRILN